VDYVEKPMSAFEQIVLDMSRNARTAAMVRDFGPVAQLLQGQAGEQLRSELSWLQKPHGACRCTRWRTASAVLIAA
jgi:hypothetical protein